MMKESKLLRTLDWSEKRFQVVKIFQMVNTYEFIRDLSFFYQKINIKISIRLHKYYKSYLKKKDFIYLFKNNKKLLKDLFVFMQICNGIYLKFWKYTKKIRNYYLDTSTTKHSMLKFIFTKQQIFFQLFINNPDRPDTHSTVGTLIRIKENLRVHENGYIFRKDMRDLEDKLEELRDKKKRWWYRRRTTLHNIRDLIVKKNLIRPRFVENRELALRKAKKELLLQRAKKKNKNLENLIIYNKRWNPKTEPLYGKCQRRKFSTWLWFVKCMYNYLESKDLKIYRKVILLIKGLVRVHKLLLKYILATFEKLQILIFLIKVQLKYRGAKLKHFTTIRKKTRKRYIKMEQNSFFK